ncbi:MAG: 6-hydroxymethylpterin diphosphokinase MptE-like protein [Pseudomonadota bacterium]
MSNDRVFQDNLAALDKTCPDIAARVRESEKSGSGPNRYELFKAKTGEPNVLVLRDTDAVFLYDNESPLDYCRKYFDGLNTRHAPIVVFLGFGLGFHLYLFMRFYADKWGTKKIIVIEEDPDLFRLALQTVDLREILTHPHIDLFVGESLESVLIRIQKAVIWKWESFGYMRTTKVIPLPSHIVLNPDYYMRAVSTIRTAFREAMFLFGNDPTDSFVGLDNLLGNLSQVVANPGINLLFEKFRNRPAVIVASGPSLSKNMDQLREIGDRALILSCDASLVPLVQRNMRPHIVVTLERTEGTFHFFEHAGDCSDMYLALLPLVRANVFESFNGKKLIVHRAFSHFNWLHYDKGTLNFGPSVANMGFRIADALGCSPIILVGQDLAMAEDGNTHVKELIFGERDEIYYESVFEVEGNDGRPVKTCKEWNTFRLCFEEDLETYEGVCINATEGGARIRGAKVMPLAEAIRDYCREVFHPKAVIEESVSDFYRNVDFSRELENFIPRIRATREAVSRSIETFKSFHDKAREISKDRILPFIHDDVMIDAESLMEFIGEFVALRASFLSNEYVHDIMVHTLQPQILWFDNKFNSLPEVYSDERCLRAAQILMIKDWAGVVGQFLVSTLDCLEKAEEKLVKELKGNP